MLNEKEYPKFKYFLESYFNISADYDELGKLINTYKEVEPKGYIEEFRYEISKLLKLDDRLIIWLFIKKHGRRTMANGKFKWFLECLDKNM